MDEQTIQEIRALSQEIVINEFPQEREYFDSLFDLTIREIEGLEPGKEAEFLKDMKTILPPELVLGYSPIVIIIIVQITRNITYLRMPEDENREKIANAVKDKITNVVKDKNEQKNLLPIIKYVIEYFKEK